MFWFAFIADEFGQARVVRFQALEEKQERIVPAPFEFVAGSADLLQVGANRRDRAIFWLDQKTPSRYTSLCGHDSYHNYCGCVGRHHRKDVRLGRWRRWP